ncbi:MAG: porin family protein [Ignavibacteria bacterium]|jgi:opacity protein-like surface antigen
MKKINCLVIAILILGTLPAYSQSSEFQMNRFSLGVIGGLNFADLHFPNSQGPDDQEISTRLGMAIGAVLDIRISENIFARIEPMYIQKGGKIEEGTDPINQPEGKIKSSSIEIPILIQFTFGNKIKPYLIAGPTLGYNLKSEIEFEVTGLKFKGDLKEVTETFDLGLTFGGGVQVPAGFGEIILEARYNYGLINQQKGGTTTVSSNSIDFELDSDKEEDKFTNRGFQLLAGISIPLGVN